MAPYAMASGGAVLRGTEPAARAAMACGAWLGFAGFPRWPAAAVAFRESGETVPGSVRDGSVRDGFRRSGSERDRARGPSRDGVRCLARFCRIPPLARGGRCLQGIRRNRAWLRTRWLRTRWLPEERF